MVRFLLSLFLTFAALVILQLIAITFVGGVGGSLGIRPVSHKCVGLVIRGEITSALPTADVGMDVFLHVRYKLPAQREGVRLCLGQDVWMGE